MRGSLSTRSPSARVKRNDKHQESEIVAFDEDAARRFDELRSRRHRVRTMDLKIVATALVNNARLLSAN